MNKYFFIICTFCVHLSLDGQDRGFDPVDLSNSHGMGNSAIQDLGAVNLNVLANESGLLRSFQDSFPDEDYWHNSTSYSMKFLVGFQSKNRADDRASTAPRFRLGVDYRLDHSSYQYFNSQNYRIDTLISTQSGEMTFIDSSAQHELNLAYRSQMIGLHLSYVYSTERDKAWSIYGGIGGGIGIGFNNRTEVRMSQSAFQASGVFSGNEFDNQQESFVNKSAMTFSLFIPMGLNWSIVTRSGQLGRVNLYMETNPGISYFNAPEFDPQVNATIDLSFGIRVDVRSRAYLNTDRLNWKDRYLGRTVPRRENRAG